MQKNFFIHKYIQQKIPHIFFWVLGGFVFLLPLFYSFQSQQIFEVNKFFLLSLFAGFLAFLLTFHFFFSRGFREKKPSVSLSFGLWSSLFFLCIFCSALFSDTPLIAFLGGGTRHQGVIFFGYLYIIFLSIWIFLSSVSHKEKIEMLKKFFLFPLLVSSLLVSSVAISQFFGDFSGKIYGGYFFNFEILQIQDVSMRSFASLGQPNFLAQFLLIPIFVTLFLLFNSKNRRTQFIFVFCLLFLSFGLYTTGSRAGILGLLCGITALFLLRSFSQKNFWRICIGLLISGIFILIYVLNSPEVLEFIGERSRSFLARIQFWKESLPILFGSVHHFFLGVGGDNLGYIFQPLASVKLNELEGFSYLPDRAHSIWLDIPLHYGVLASFILFGWIGKIFTKTIQGYYAYYSEQKDENTLSEEVSLAILLLAGMIATLASWSFGFFVTTDSSIFILSLGILAVLKSKIQTKSNLPHKKEQKSKKTDQFSQKLISSCILFFGISIGIFCITLGITTRNADIARFALEENNSTKEHYGQEILSPAEKQKHWKNAVLAPQLQENMISLFYIAEEKTKKKILNNAEQYSYTSHQYTLLRLQKSLILGDQESIAKNFLLAKKSLGNALSGNISLFQLANQTQILSQKELTDYAQEIQEIVPKKYRDPSQAEQPEVQKFWKHHSEYSIILDYLAE